MRRFDPAGVGLLMEGSEGGRWPRSRPWLGRALRRRHRAISLSAETIKMARRLNIDFSIQGHRAAEAASVERDMRKDLRFIGGFDDIKSTGGPALTRISLGGRVIEHGDI